MDWADLGQALWLKWRVWQRRRGETIETAYAITRLLPKAASAEKLLALWRRHWGIETRLHYVTLSGDACQIKSGAAPPALAAVRNTVISLVRLAGGPNVAAALRRFAANPPRPSLPSASPFRQVKRP